MSDVLTTICRHAAERVEERKRERSAEEVKRLAESAPRGDFIFEKTLKSGGRKMICEIKRASPSKGLICRDFDPIAVARDYEAAGADCLSVLTEPKWFLGSDEIFKSVRAVTRLPMLRKDFVVDEYQIYEAELMGADAVLLIASVLGQKIKKYQDICSLLGISALVETHDESEIRLAAECGAKIIGVNNRNLKDFSVDFSNVANLRGKIPRGAIFVAESGVSSPADAASLFHSGADAVLCGEALMRSPDRAAFLREVKGG